VPAPADSVDQTLEQFRAYLSCLAHMRIDPRLQGKFGIPDVIQQTLLEAYQALERVRQLDAEGRKKWLRTALAHNLLEEVAKFRTQARDVRREHALDRAAAESSCRLEAWLACEQSTPSQKLERQESDLRVAEALARLPEPQRQAIILQHWHGWTLGQIAERLGRTPGAVAGLLHRGLEKLGGYLPERE
jgi:RNA polymerase sigma-70 factor (ECF subfamily)